MNRRRWRWTLICAGITFARAVTLAESPQLLNAPDRPSASGNGNSSAPQFSADGRFLLFLSEAKNLVPEGNLSPYVDIFRKDMARGEVILVSRNANGLPANGHSGAYSVSSNGNWIAFESAASDLVPNDTNSSTDIFLHDVVNGTTTLVSVDIVGRSPGNPAPQRGRALSRNPLISCDGRWVVFESGATNLTSEPDTNGVPDIFARDVVGNTTVRVTVQAGGPTETPNWELLQMVACGRYVLFNSAAQDSSSQYGEERLLLHDLFENTQQSASVTNWSSPFFRVRSIKARMSEDGSAVVYKATSLNRTMAGLIYYDLRTRTNFILTTAPPRTDTCPQITPDGRFVIYDTDMNNSGIYLWDRETRTNALIALTSPFAGNYWDFSAAHISPNGERVLMVGSVRYGQGNPRMGQLFAVDRVGSSTRMISRFFTGQPSTKDHRVRIVAFHPNGQLTAFDSFDNYLAPDDLNQASDIFIYDWLSDTNLLASSRHQSRPNLTGSSSAEIGEYSISADGQVILFTSVDSTLHAGDTNRWRDAFVKNFLTGRTEPLTLQTNGPFNRAAHAPVLSANGRYVVTSMLHLPYDVSYIAATFDMIWIDLLTAERRTLIRGQSISGSFNPPLPSASISADGQAVAYSDGNNVYVKNMATGSNELASAKADGTPMNTSRDPVISANGRYVLFTSNQTLFIRDILVRTNRAIGNHFRNPVFSRDLAYVLSSSPNRSAALYDISNNTSSTVCQSCRNPSMSGDGQLIAYEHLVTGSPGQIMLRDRNGSTNLISRNVLGTGAGNGSSHWPVLSHDGRFLVFVSRASDLTLGDENTWADFFVRDLVRGTTLRITGASNNSGHGSGPASKPVLGPDGRTLVFRSFASDFADGDYSDQRDLFLLRLNAGDSDDDGLPDDWEVAHFDDLSRNGFADFDSDGHTDLQECTAGTDPTDRNSVFQVISLTSPQTGQVRLFWSAVPGATYRVEYKHDLSNTSWAALPGLVNATDSTASLSDLSAPSKGKRFYRVMLIR